LVAERCPQSSPALDETQREQIILEHIGLVKYIVGRVAVRLPDSVDREDLESAGIVGLIKAADRYEPGRGVKFATYASTVIRGEVMELLRSRDWAPRSVRKRYRELEDAIAQLQRQLGRQPSETEICQRLRLSPSEYQELLSLTSSLAVSSLEEMMETVGLLAGALNVPMLVLADESYVSEMSEKLEQLSLPSSHKVFKLANNVVRDVVSRTVPRDLVIIPTVGSRMRFGACMGRIPEQVAEETSSSMAVMIFPS